VPHNPLPYHSSQILKEFFSSLFKGPLEKNFLKTGQKFPFIVSNNYFFKNKSAFSTLLSCLLAKFFKNRLTRFS